MATATAKAPKQFTVRFELTGDADMDAEPFNVVSPSGDHEACFETEAEAVAFADECNAALAEEAEAAEECEREELVAALQAAVEEMGLAELRRLAKRLLD